MAPLYAGARFLRVPGWKEAYRRCGLAALAGNRSGPSQVVVTERPSVSVANPRESPHGLILSLDKGQKGSKKDKNLSIDLIWEQ